MGHWQLHEMTNKSDHRIAFRIPAGLARRVAELAGRTGKSRGYVARAALAAGIDALEHRQPAGAATNDQDE